MDTKKYLQEQLELLSEISRSEKTISVETHIELAKTICCLVVQLKACFDFEQK